MINFCQSKPRDWTDASIIKTPLYAIDKITIKFGDETTRSSHEAKMTELVFQGTIQGRF